MYRAIAFLVNKLYFFISFFSSFYIYKNIKLRLLKSEYILRDILYFMSKIIGKKYKMPCLHFSIILPQYLCT